MLELVLVLMMVTLVLAISASGYRAYVGRGAAKHASELFAVDLALARTVARRDRTPASVVFVESETRYLIRKVSGEVILERRYGSGSEVRLSQIEVELPGDSVTFNGRGIADLSAVQGSLGVARFAAGTQTYVVVFNAMGASDIQQP